MRGPAVNFEKIVRATLVVVGVFLAGALAGHYLWPVSPQIAELRGDIAVHRDSSGIEDRIAARAKTVRDSIAAAARARLVHTRTQLPVFDSLLALARVDTVRADTSLLRQIGEQHRIMVMGYEATIADMARVAAKDLERIATLVKRLAAANKLLERGDDVLRTAVRRHGVLTDAAIVVITATATAVGVAVLR